MDNKKIRKTSIEAYNKLVLNGGLSEARRKVYDYLYRNGSSTQKTVERFFGDTVNTIRPRFAELEKMGLIETCGISDCKETGVKNLLWDVTDSTIPKKIEKTKTNKQKKEELLSMIKDLTSTTSDIFIVHDLNEITSYININFNF